MYLENCHPLSSLKQAVKAPLEVKAFRLQGKWPELPEQIRAFQNLEILIVKGGGLEKLPAWLSELPLKALELSNNPVRRLVPLPLLEELQMQYAQHCPEGLENLLGLRRLDLSYGQMEKLAPLPAQLYELTVDQQPLRALPRLPAGLKVLKLSGCRLTELPELPGLTTLDVGGNPLRSLPTPPSTLEILKLENLGQRRFELPPLPALRELHLSFNSAPLPQDLEAFPRLEVLFAVGCELEGLPDSLGRLSQLNWLNVNVNRLRSLPGALAACHRLSLLYAKGNLLKTLPDLRHLPLAKVMLGGNPLPEDQFGRLPSSCEIDREDAGWLISQPDLEERVAASFGAIVAAPLVPLRIPAGWTVNYNQFREEVQTDSDTTLFTASLLDYEVRLEVREGLYQVVATTSYDPQPDWRGAATALEAALAGQPLATPG